MADLVGRASAHGLHGEVAVWRFAVASGDAASAVAGLLGGVPQVGGGGWEIVTAASVLAVLRVGLTNDALRFRLEGLPALGAFELRFSPWCLVDVLGEEAAALPGLVGLAARVQDFTTLNGRTVRYVVPALV
ncbi:hypothetical protein ACIQGZ_29090 [Streptomyces sp. NPDC092296]|uniref:hypothetical protein n=1 Tax=Streptomyces sp. NPDC092296 TaxID=3366012 RepID=UPI00381AFEF2